MNYRKKNLSKWKAMIKIKKMRRQKMSPLLNQKREAKLKLLELQGKKLKQRVEHSKSLKFKDADYFFMRKKIY